MPSRRRVWEVLEGTHPDDPAGRAFTVGILVLIALNVLAVVLETVPRFDAAYGSAFDAFETFSVAVFAVEYLARLWSAPADPRYAGPIRGRLRFALTPMALIDLLAIVPFFLPYLDADLRVARAIRLLRFLRIAKAGRYVSALRLFRNVATSKREELVLTVFIVALLLLISSSLMYFAEHDAQPEAFSSIPASMWWAVETLTTVGYGDILPVTTLGRVLGSAVAILGIGLFALPAALLGAGFVEEIARTKQPRRCPHCNNELPNA
ncbi:MAG TPA: ion transporter [Gemmatimonadales bacterium]